MSNSEKRDLPAIWIKSSIRFFSRLIFFHLIDFLLSSLPCYVPDIACDEKNRSPLCEKLLQS